MLRDPTFSVRLIICASMRFDPDPFLACPVPIVVPSIQERGGELTRIVDEYVLDALGALSSARCASEINVDMAPSVGWASRRHAVAPMRAGRWQVPAR